MTDTTAAPIASAARTPPPTAVVALTPGDVLACLASWSLSAIGGPPAAIAGPLELDDVDEVEEIAELDELEEAEAARRCVRFAG